MKNTATIQSKNNIAEGHRAYVWIDDGYDYEPQLVVRVFKLLEDQGKAICTMDGEKYTFLIEDLSPMT